MDEATFLRLSRKKQSVLEAIDPICAVFNIENVDYKINTETLNERLCIGNLEIGCTGNSVSAVVDELIAYIFVTRYCQNRSLGAFEKQTLNVIKRYWRTSQIDQKSINPENSGKY